MSFETLSAAALAAALSAPPLVLLYFLKLRRQRAIVSSTLLWRQAFEDLQVNVPFQKIRRNLLLIIQLLVLFTVLAALAQPVVTSRNVARQAVVLLIDQSVGMNTREADGRTRLQHAIDAAAAFVEGLPDQSRVMIISFADRPEIVSSFSDERAGLVRRMRQIGPTDAPGRLAEALDLAVAYAKPERAQDQPADTEAQEAADIEVFSGGQIAEARSWPAISGEVHYHPIGRAEDNVGIVDFHVQRELDRPDALGIFVRVQNFGPRPVESDVSLLLDGRLPDRSGAIREVQLGPAARPSDAPGERAGGRVSDSASLAFEIEQAAAGILEVRLHRRDALAADDRVLAPLSAPRPLRVLLVTTRPAIRQLFRQALVKALDVRHLEEMTPSQYESVPESRLAVGGRSAFDLVILDGHDSDRLPPGCYFFMDGLPKIEGVRRTGRVANEPLVTGREDHALLRHVSFDQLLFTRWRRLALPPTVLPLLEGPDSVLLALWTDAAHRYVIAAFDLLDSDWALKPAFPVFMQNLLQFAGPATSMEPARWSRPGEAINLSAPRGTSSVRVVGPGGDAATHEIGEASMFTYAEARRVGLYRFEFKDRATTVQTIGCNLVDAAASDIRPRSSLSMGSRAVSARTVESLVRKPLWPWAVGAALGLLMVEWWIYNRRVMV